MSSSRPQKLENNTKARSHKQLKFTFFMNKKGPAYIFGFPKHPRPGKTGVLWVMTYRDGHIGVLKNPLVLGGKGSAIRVKCLIVRKSVSIKSVRKFYIAGVDLNMFLQTQSYFKFADEILTCNYKI